MKEAWIPDLLNGVKISLAMGPYSDWDQHKTNEKFVWGGVIVDIFDISN